MVDKVTVKIRVFIFLLSLSLLAQACNAPTSVSQSTSQVDSSTLVSTRFAAGTKAVKLNTHDLPGGSFSVPAILPVATPVPVMFPGYDGSSTYLPGVSAQTFYDVDGVTVIQKPAWLLDFQLGLSALPGTGTCASFGTTANADASGFYRTSEINCGGASNVGTGRNTDKNFIRLILNRDVSLLGSAENLLIQIEYQASGLHLNSDGIDPSPENNLDQLWKVFWNTSLAGSSAPNIFSTFVPPNQSACLPGGTGTTGTGSSACVNGYKGAPITMKQIIMPLSAYPNLSVIQLSRMKGRINSTDTFSMAAPSPGPVNYVVPFFASSSSTDCQADSPLCLGLVIRSVMIMRL